MPFSGDARKWGAMSEAEVETNEPGGGAAAPRRRRRWLLPASLVAVLAIALALGTAWFSRNRIATNLIESQLAGYGLPATYKIASIGADRQVLTDIVVGDPKRPDLTIKRAVIEPSFGFHTPGIGKVTLVEPRLYGSLHDGKLSFGSLDKVIFAKSEEPPSLPDIGLSLVDGRALLESDYGPVGIKAQGEGNLRWGFSGIVAANAPKIAAQGCKADGATLYGKVTTSRGEPHFSGPLRLAALRCADGARLDDAALTVTASSGAKLAAYDVAAKGVTGRLAYGASSIGKSTLDIRGAWREGRLNANYTLAGSDVSTPQARLAALSADGTLRGDDGFARMGLEARITGQGIAPGAALDTTLGSLAASAGDTLAGPMIAQIRRELAQEARGSTLAANLSLRRMDGRLSLAVPEANWRGGSGTTLLAVSRFSLTDSGNGAPLVAGNLSTGGNLPRIAGRMERMGANRLALRMTMAPYHADDGVLAMPELVVVQDRGGAIGFSGRVDATGKLPGGFAQRLRLPVSGSWSPATGLAMWRECTDIAFDRLELSAVKLVHRGLKLCPANGQPILRYDSRGLKLAAGTPALALDGTLAETPLSLRSGPVGFAWPGNFTAQSVDVALGPQDNAARFHLADLDAALGQDVSGHFSGTDAKLDAVPLDVLGAAGEWDYSNGELTLSNASFQLADRQATPRFEQLTATGATLDLRDNAITADAVLREPKTGREVSAVAISHDLASGKGEAQLAVPGLQFDEALQPDELSYLVKGFIANAKGTITGKGDIRWNENGVTSSTGSFSSDGFDLAAAFGPVQGISGTVHFSDLLALTTAPDQQLRIASVNPGIEARDGIVTFALKDGQVLTLQEGSWPFLGGKLDLQPVTLDFSHPARRRYVIELSGVDAALFVQQMELDNISASGLFDGTLPLEFDEMGNGSIVDGQLVSRAPGGNVSYVGQLTYKDLSPIANYAFDALRSLDYSKMTIDMEGPLTGYIVSKVRFEGISQGEGASKNFVTRQISKLPLQFNINVKAKFYDLIRNVRSLYDPAFTRDPREVGLDTGGADSKPQAEPAIQDQASETMP